MYPSGRQRSSSYVLAIAPYAVLVPCVLWWMCNVALWMLGALDTGQWGYRAWLAGLSGFPRWVQSILASTGVVTWAAGVVVLGGVATIRGRTVVRPLIGVLASSMLLTVLVVLAATWVWPDAPR